MLKSKLLIFKVGRGKYACNITSIDRIIKYENLTYVPSKQETFEAVYNHEGLVIKIFNLAKILGVENDSNNTHKKIIIAKNNEVLVGIVVDEVLEVFNYNKEEHQNNDQIKELPNKMRDIDLNYVKDMILLDDEIIMYLSIAKIIEHELEKSDL